MNKQEFLAALKAELSFISLDEREDAIKYYEEYFDDAGEENEASIINELESPKKLAEKILSDLGYTKESLRKIGNIELKLIENLDEIEDIEKIKKIENIEKVEKAENIVELEEVKDINTSDKKREEQENKHTQKSEYNNNDNNSNPPPQQYNKSSNRGLIAVLLLLSSPIWVPIFLGICSVIVALFCAFFAASISFFAAALSGAVVAVTGIGMLVYGVITLFTSLYVAITMIGQGFLCLGIGMIIGYIFFKLAVFILKWQFKIIGKMFRGVIGALSAMFSGRRNYNAA